MTYVTHHARQRLRERAGYKNPMSETERAWTSGKTAGDVESKALARYMTRRADDDQTMRYYRGRIWLFGVNGGLITIMQIPRSIQRQMARGR